MNYSYDRVMAKQLMVVGQKKSSSQMEVPIVVGTAEYVRGTELAKILDTTFS